MASSARDKHRLLKRLTPPSPFKVLNDSDLYRLLHAYTSFCFKNLWAIYLIIGRICRERKEGRSRRGLTE